MFVFLHQDDGLEQVWHLLFPPWAALEETLKSPGLSGFPQLSSGAPAD